VPEQSAPEELPARPIWWLVARERASELGDGEQKYVLGRLLAHVEAGWAMAAELAGFVDEPSTYDEEVVPLFLAFVKAEVLDPFVRLALASANMALALGDASGERPFDPDADHIDSEAERFSRNVLVVHLASSDPAVPQALRDTVRRASRNLLDWFPDFSVLAAATARLIVECRAPTGR
jgi:hypothetical protein